MLYQKYKQHLTKRWKLFEKLWHFRFLILLILVLVIALTVTLLAITGNVSLVSCPETVEYGSAYAPEGHAIFRQSTVQYRAKGAPESAWTEERPIVIGSYEARAVSRSFFGSTKISETASFEICPKEIEIRVVEPFLYGEEPTATGDLAYQDRFEGVSFDKKRQDDVTHFSVTPYKVRILNGQGEDVTYCYSVEKSLAEASHVDKSLVDESLADGSLVGVTCDVTVLPRPITVTTAGAEKMYDGLPLFAEEYELTEGTLASGDSLRVAFVSGVAAGTYENIPDCTVISADGTDVTENYAFTFRAGTLSVAPRPITVKTASQIWIYDGKPHRADGTFEVEGLLSTHKAFVLNAIALTEVTDTADEVRYRDNEISIGVLDAEGKDVTANYEITYDYGKLRIKTKILLTVYSLQKKYDGTPLMFEAGDCYVVKPPDVSVFLDLAGFSLTDVGTLPLRAVFDAPLSVTDPLTGRDVRDENLWEFVGNADDPILTVAPRRLEITSNSIVAIPSGQTLYGWAGTNAAWISFGTLAKGHTIQIEVTGTLSPDAPSAENTIASVKIFDAFSVDVTDNYEIELHPGTLAWLS